MKLIVHHRTTQYKGGSGSGHYGHAGRPGLVGGSASTNRVFDYPKNAKTRRNSSNYPGSGPYTDIDLAVKEPVRIMNEELGLHTFASCEGHCGDWKVLPTLGTGYKKPDDRYSYSLSFQESYIAAYYPRGIEEFVQENGFKIGSTSRSNVVEESYDYYKNMTTEDGKEYHLVLSVRKPIPNAVAAAPAQVSFRVSSRHVDPAKVEPHTLSTGQSFINISESLQGQSYYSQKDWDTVRDAGWNSWLDLLTDFKSTKKEFAIKLIAHYKGGPGSGFRNHAGRPGLVGGSTSENAVLHVAQTIYVRRYRDRVRTKIYDVSGRGNINSSDINMIVSDIYGEMSSGISRKMPVRVIYNAETNTWYIPDNNFADHADFQGVATPGVPDYKGKPWETYSDAGYLDVAKGRLYMYDHTASIQHYINSGITLSPQTLEHKINRVMKKASNNVFTLDGKDIVVTFIPDDSNAWNMFRLE